MTCLHIRTRILAAAIALALVPAFAYAEGDALSKKDAPAGRSRLNPRTEDGSALAGTPMDTATATPAPAMLGFGPMMGNPLLGSAVPVKSGN